MMSRPDRFCVMVSISASRFLFVLSAGALALEACVSPDAHSGSASSSTTSQATVAETSTTLALPRVIGPGLGPLEIPPAAVLPANGGRSPNKWCTEFGNRQLTVGDTITLLWPDTAGTVPSIVTVVSRVRTDSVCVYYGLAPDGLPSEEGDESYELVPAEPVDPARVHNVRPGIAVWGHVRWVRGPDHLLRADIDGDGKPEIARSCSTQEAVNLTIWTVIEDPVTGKQREVRRWKAYRPLGFDDVPDCTERESEDDPDAPLGY
jgi:hypothetical protein